MHFYHILCTVRHQQSYPDDVWAPNVQMKSKNNHIVVRARLFDWRVISGKWNANTEKWMSSEWQTEQTGRGSWRITALKGVTPTRLLTWVNYESISLSIKAIEDESRRHPGCLVGLTQLCFTALLCLSQFSQLGFWLSHAANMTNVALELACKESVSVLRQIPQSADRKATIWFMNMVMYSLDQEQILFIFLVSPGL